MPPIRDLLWGILFPALAAGCTWAFVGGVWFKKDARWVTSLAVAVAFCIGYAGLLRGAPWEPASAREWLFWLAAGGALIAPLESWTKRDPFIVRAVFVGFLLTLVLNRQFENHWTGPEATSQFPDVAIAVCLSLAGWHAIERIAKRHPGAGAPMVLWCAATGLALCCLWSSSGLYAQLAGTVAAAMGAAVVLSWVRPGTWFAGGGAGLAWGMLFGIGLAAHYYSQLSTSDVLLLASTPFVARLADLPGVRRQSPSRHAALRVAVVLIPIAIACYRTYGIYAAQDAGGYGY